MPGFTVSGDGNITAQGKAVQKVFIDGEEFLVMTLKLPYATSGLMQ
ncbi:hypothetical protein KUH03_21975 [Sphingobacterium sp. E70]|nr:hypothetical protein [Sphingobacterium sp. E70]ULT22159.1 hypothetical protein KUH03_21975 [Sphingobacterium sp. E70]